MERERSIVKYKSKKFALRIIALYKVLSECRRENIMSKQILRSGTSVGANITEALNGSSRKDFLNKMYIAFKECNETYYWLELFHESGYISEDEFKSMSKDCLELIKMLSSITKTTRSFDISEVKRNSGTNIGKGNHPASDSPQSLTPNF